MPRDVPLAALLGLAWKRPYTAGVILLVLALPVAVADVAVLVVRDLPLARALWIALPPVVTGLLLVKAGRRERAPR